MTLTTEDDITPSDIDSTYKVLETLREMHTAPYEERINDAHYAVQMYEEAANFEDARVRHARAHRDYSATALLNSAIERLFGD